MRVGLSPRGRRLALIARITFLLSRGAVFCFLRPLARRNLRRKKIQRHKDYALIFGTVWGRTTVPWVAYPIKIRRATDKKPKWELVSDSNGEFAQRVPVGTMEYIIQANIKTPKGQPKPEITVQIDRQ